MSTVAVVGASDNPSRYSHRAMRQLRACGYEAVPVSLRGQTVAGCASVRSVRAIEQAPDTVTIYVAPQHQGPIVEDLLASRPRRVIFNPGSENPEAASRLRAAGIDVVEACTLVMLASGTF